MYIYIERDSYSISGISLGTLAIVPTNNMNTTRRNKRIHPPDSAIAISSTSNSFCFEMQTQMFRNEKKKKKMEKAVMESE